MGRWTEGRTLLLAGAGAALLARTALRGPAADLRGEVALITGGSRGLGLLIARELGRQGCKLVICARDAKELARAQADLEGAGMEVLAISCDVTDNNQVRSLYARARQHFGQIDILVNNAGIIQAGPLPAMTRGDFEDALNDMFWGVYNLTMAVLPAMRERRHGRIVNVTSIGGKVAVPHLLPYATAKFAATGFSEGLRAELAGSGISVTTIVPGLMRTGSVVKATFKGHQEREYGWFALAASLPLISMDAERAARQIVAAARHGQAERILSFPAMSIALTHGVLPGLTSDMLGLVNRLLPGAEGPTAAIPGEQARRQLHSSLIDMLTGWGRDAADRFNERQTSEAASNGNHQHGDGQ